MDAKIYLFKTAEIDLDQSDITWAEGFGKTVTLPILQALICLKDMNLLFDTGIREDDRDDAYSVVRRKTSDLERQMEMIGYRPSDIHLVINSHLHRTHCGGNYLFKRSSQFVVHRYELRYAYYPDEFQRTRYNRKDFDLDLNWLPIAGDYEICPGVKVLFTPGHTFGNLSVLIEGGKSNYLLCGDACFTKINWETNKIPAPALTLNVMSYYDTLKWKLKTMRNVEPIFGHDVRFLGIEAPILLK
jgi:glyoxylase-like metal-dependent hydrolase (beta-lactamase superfamily II)